MSSVDGCNYTTTHKLPCYSRSEDALTSIRFMLRERFIRRWVCMMNERGQSHGCIAVLAGFVCVCFCVVGSWQARFARKPAVSG